MVERHISQFFRQQQLPTSQCAPYLLAVSGGKDSMVMAHAFHALGIPIALAHCNFQLRGAESDRDEEFVKAWAQKHRVDCHTERFQTKDTAQQQGISVQMAARQLRYAFFERLRQMLSLSFISTAHHGSDNIETALYQFIRGGGLAGLSGIPATNGHIIRPMLHCSRAEIDAYAQKHQIEWREDSSNATDAYHRNYIRHHIITAIEEQYPQFSETAADSVSNLRKSYNNYRWLLHQYLKKHLITDSAHHAKLDLEALTSMPEPTELLRFWLLPKGYYEDQIAQIAAHLTQVGWNISAGNTQLTVDRKVLLLQDTSAHALPDVRIHEDDIMVRLGGGLTVCKTHADMTHPLKTTPDTILVPSRCLSWPLTVRGWLQGDTFQPFGMQGLSQKLQDYFVNNKISGPDKEQMRILVNGDGTIIWLMGMRSDERFRVLPDDQSLVKFTLIDNSSDHKV